MWNVWNAIVSSVATNLLAFLLGGLLWPSVLSLAGFINNMVGTLGRIGPGATPPTAPLTAKT